MAAKANSSVPVDSTECVLLPVLEVEGAGATGKWHRELRTRKSKRLRKGIAADSMEGKGMESD